ncbi:hypothetical protein Scep_024082 [Stephania cephalantha]|uniref:Uncharacterized protein n=1 Tax=Stephania cephalantha TaxID=152367 RepID=A0AAP0F1B1_9MAGN
MPAGAPAWTAATRRHGRPAADELQQPHELRGKLQARWRMANQRVAAATREAGGGAATGRRGSGSWKRTPAGSSVAGRRRRHACGGSGSAAR